MINLAQVFVAGLLFWYAVLGPIYILLLGVGVWAAASVMKNHVCYSAVLKTGFFAAIAAIYAEYLKDRINVYLTGIRREKQVGPEKVLPQT